MFGSNISRGTQPRSSRQGNIGCMLLAYADTLLSRVESAASAISTPTKEEGGSGMHVRR